MKLVKLITLLLLSSIAHDAAATGWYSDITSYMGRIEQVDGNIWLMRPADNQVAIMVEGCEVNQVKLTAPQGMVDQWMTIVLTATAMKKPLTVWAECDVNNKMLVATRLILNY